jgi:hypothetical protein
MTVVATEALTAEQMVKIAREQVDAFNTSDWERMQAGLTDDAATTSLLRSARSRARSRSSALQGLEDRSRWHGTVTSALQRTIAALS